MNRKERKMTTIRPRRIVRLGLVALSVAALLSPAAQANHQNGDGLRDATAISAAPQVDPTAADLIVAQENARRSDPRVIAMPSTASPVTLPTGGASGFDWRAAVIGAGFALTVALFGAGAGLVIRRRGGTAALRS
jgi:hypothetical protein